MRLLLCAPLFLTLLAPLDGRPQPAGGRCRAGGLDLVFLVDSSRSVRPWELEATRGFLVALIRGLDVGPNATRVGLVQYSSRVRRVFPLDAFSRPDDVERAVRAMAPLARGTMTGLALQYAANVAFTGPEGARPAGARVPRVAVVVTDGRPQDRVAEAASRARARGIEIYAVGVRRADVDSLRAMASPPLDSHVFLVDSFDALAEAGLRFRGRLCDADLCAGQAHGCQHLCVSGPGSFHCACDPGYRLDADNKSCSAIDVCAEGTHDCQHLCVASPGSYSCRCREGYILHRDQRSCTTRDLCNGVDHGCEFQCVSVGSSYRCACPEGRRLQADGKSCGRCGSGPTDLVLVIDGSKSVGAQQFELVKRWVGELVGSLDVSPAGTRVGLVQFSSRVRTEFPLGRHGTKAEAEAAVRAVTPMDKGTMTGLALRHLVERGFSEAEGARPGSRRVGLLVTDGRSQDDVSPWAARAKDRGIVMFAVGVGKAVEEELREIASDPVERHVSYAADFGALTRLLDHLKLDTCPGRKRDRSAGWGGPSSVIVSLMVSLRQLWVRVEAVERRLSRLSRFSRQN
ncbi:matrilin-4 [Ornithorhynchus anatinus]|uniref:matrilin-4 n=1 Tax=Ornithorhynchus anatinus TaxID=9258 RepID=UPI0019D4970E|nr:matrilin-4 [Ornithorhynchus anatinus]